jgi:hypothetical protein
MEGFCEHGNETPYSTKGEELVDELSDYEFFNKDLSLLS